MCGNRCSESKSLVQGVERSIVIGAVADGLPQGTCSLAEVGGSELEAFFFLKMDQLSLTPSPLKLGETILVVISKLWHLITTCMSSPM